MKDNSNKLILLVDDDKDVLDTFHDALEIRGYDTITATNGKDAIDFYKQKSPSLVFMDALMPEMDGYETFSKIKEINKDAKVVIVTGNTSNEKSHDALKNGLLTIIEKPYDIEQILSIIKEDL